MSKAEKIKEQIKSEIRAGMHGRVRDRFMTTRDLAQRTNTSIATAQKIMTLLKEEGVLIADATNPSIISPQAVDSPESASPKRLGLVVTHIASPFFSDLSQKIQKAAAEMGYQTLVSSSEYSFDREREIIEEFLAIGVEGLLVCPGIDERCLNLYNHLASRHIPLGLVSRKLDGWDNDFVAANNFVGSFMVGEHLIEKGYDSFGYISFCPRPKRDERLNGFQAALQEAGIELPEEYIVDGEGGDLGNGWVAMEKLMSLPKPPRAVFAFHDLLAIGAMQYCQSNNIKIPQAVAVAGFDNLPESRVTSPALTTVEYPIESMAKLAVVNLLDKIQNPNKHTPSRIMLEPHLITRQSSDLQSPNLSLEHPLRQENTIHPIG